MVSNLARARVVGARTGMSLAALMGASLAALSDELVQCLVILAVTALVVVAAHPIGTRIGASIVGHGALRAMGLGVAGGLVCLVIASLGASALFAAKMIGRGSDLGMLFREEVSMLFLIIAMVGAPFATTLGVVHGLVVHRLTRSMVRA